MIYCLSSRAPNPLVISVLFLVISCFVIIQQKKHRLDTNETSARATLTVVRSGAAEPSSRLKCNCREEETMEAAAVLG